MKKTMVYIVAILLLSVAVVTLFAMTDNTPGGAQQEGGTASVSFTRDKTVLPDFIYNSSIIAESPVYTIRLTDDGLDDEKDADYVVLGTVIETFYTFIDGRAWTQANIRIDEITRGRLSEGQIISVYMPGGYASAEDYIASQGQVEKAAAYASYFEFIINGEPHPQPGDNAVFCLDKLPSGSSLPKGAYLRLNVVIDEGLDPEEGA